MSKRPKGPAQENRRRRKLVGWQRESLRRATGDFAPIVYGPTKWELLLRRLEIFSDDRALEILRGQWPTTPAKRNALRAFARENCARLFVPENVLDLLGLQREAERGGWGLKACEGD
ncbi:MAG TPA: hypothetical protein VKB47_08665 [Terracidiphilus sp.]|nr:hypothetical protein [Terracidiphilus sp.]